MNSAGWRSAIPAGSSSFTRQGMNRNLTWWSCGGCGMPTTIPGTSSGLLPKCFRAFRRNTVRGSGSTT